MDGVILIDKDENMTSYDVIKKAKKYFDSKKIGHCGTLDPFATGLLIIGINQGTKILSFLETEYKEYEATITFGKFYDTYDKDGKVIATSEIVDHTEEEMSEVLNSFLGESMQTPPIYSAIHVNGKHLYDYARNNQAVSIEPRKINIFEIKLLEKKEDSIRIYVKCSKGTYIRSLGVDIARKLGNDGYLSALRRTRVGKYTVEDANKITDFENKTIKLWKICEILPFETFTIPDEQLYKIYNGHLMNIKSYDEFVLLNDSKGESLAIYQRSEHSYRCFRGLFNEETRYNKTK